MNNKGFAITTILYGTLILFMLLLVSMLGILAIYKGNLEKLINSNNGTRDVITIKKSNQVFNSEEEIKAYINAGNGRGLYCLSDNTCKYYSSRPGV